MRNSGFIFHFIFSNERTNEQTSKKRTNERAKNEQQTQKVISNTKYILILYDNIIIDSNTTYYNMTYNTKY